MPRRFAVSFDYLCPFARNAHEHLICALRSGADWEVAFVPYSLTQGHVAAEDTPVWERDEPTAASGILALLAGLTVRDHTPKQFLDVHEALFAARHDHGQDIRDPEVVRAVLDGAGIDGQGLLDQAVSPESVATLRREHEAAVNDHGVWGVPTFIGAKRAVFVRILDRPDGDAELARRRIEQILDLVDGAPALHELKQTDLPV